MIIIKLGLDEVERISDTCFGQLWVQMVNNGAHMSHKILVVEDNEGAREILCVLLRDSGFKVVEAGNGEVGFNKAKDERPDLIITDLSMPVLDGVDMIKLIRKSSDLDEVPILALRAFNGEMINKAIKAGADRALQKPIDLDYLLNAIERLV
jgi:CheY-like chemotaxis protein